MKLNFLILTILFFIMPEYISAKEKGCDHTVVIVFNPRTSDAISEIVEVELADLEKRHSSSHFYVIDSVGREIPSQRTYDKKFIFQADVVSKGESSYKIFPAEKDHTYENVVEGNIYPLRKDDLAWENERGGYRAYGPGTRKDGEKAYGYDIFFKHPRRQPILPILYKGVTSPENRNKLDSLRKTNPKEAKKFSRSLSYHVDHGLGMDCYAVGPTLGAGATALMHKDSIIYQGCYNCAEILDNGPIRFTCRLDFPAFTADGNEFVTEHRLITLDSKSNLNRCQVWYDGADGEIEVSVGLPLRDSSEVYSDMDLGIVAYADPTQGKNNGKAMLGIILTEKPERISRLHGHILARNTLKPGGILEYYWGFAWDRESPFDFAGWNEYLKEFSQKSRQRLDVRIHN